MSQEKFDLEEALKKLNDNPTVQKRNGTIKKKNPVKIEPRLPSKYYEISDVSNF